MKQFSILVLFYLFCVNVSAQTDDKVTSFDSKGHLVQICYADNLIQIDQASLQSLAETDKQLKQKARDLLLPKVQEAIRIIKSNHYKRSLHKLYLYIWDKDSTRLLDYLNYIETSLTKGVAANNADNLYKSFFDAFNSNFDAKNITAFYIDPKTNNKTISLWQRDIFNSFVIDYYNNSLDDILSKPNLKLTKEDIIETTYSLIEQKNYIDILLKKYQDLDAFRTSFYDSLIACHKNLTDDNSAFCQSIKMFKEDWFKKWFWFRGGEIRLNPLDVTTNDSIKKYAYRNILSQVILDSIKANSESSILEDRLDSLISFNDARDSANFTTDKKLNKVTIPAKGEFYNFSAIPDIKLENEKKYIQKTLDTNQNKALVLHNIFTGAKPGMSEKDNFFADRSPFQNGFDSIVSQFGLLAAAYAQLSPFGGVLDVFLTKRKLTNSRIDFHSSETHYDLVQRDDETGITILYNKKLVIGPFQFKYTNANEGKPFTYFLKKELTAQHLYFEDIFSLIFTDNESIKDVVNNKELLKKYQTLVNDYLSSITKKAADDLKLDSFYVANVINIYGRSTVPLRKEIDKGKDSNSIFYSKIFETSPSKKAIEKEITLFTYKDKDTVIANKFSYKVGQHYRFRLGAGIAYTLNSYDQSEAKQDGNNISVTNNVKLYRLLVGLHIYFGKGLYNQSTRFWGKDNERMYAFIGVGIPKPLENIYTGIGRDLLPGLKLTAGFQIVKNNKYLIQNNSIIEERLRYQVGGPFIALEIDPSSLFTLLNIGKK